MDTYDLNQKNVVYGLYCVCDTCAEDRPEWIRYVGITINEARKRLMDHLKPYRSKMPYPVDLWKFKHGTGNIRMRILEVVQPGEDLYEREIYWVESYKTFTDDNLGGLNRSRGGRAEQSQYSIAAIKEANSRDGVSWAKLSYEKAAQMREAYAEGVPTRIISQSFGVSQGHVTSIIKNEVWVDPGYEYEKREVVTFRDPENPSWAISREDAYEMRNLYLENPEETYESMSKRFGVSGGVVRNVLFNKKWTDPSYTPNVRINAPKRGAKIVREISQSTRDKLSSALKGVPKPEGHGQKVSQAIRGENHGMGKLKVEQVIEIRKLAKTGMRHADIGALFGVAQAQISRIVSGQRWGHVREGLD